MATRPRPTPGPALSADQFLSSDCPSILASRFRFNHETITRVTRQSNQLYLERPKTIMARECLFIAQANCSIVMLECLEIWMLRRKRLRSVQGWSLLTCSHVSILCILLVIFYWLWLYFLWLFLWIILWQWPQNSPVMWIGLLKWIHTYIHTSPRAWPGPAGAHSAQAAPGWRRTSHRIEFQGEKTLKKLDFS